MSELGQKAKYSRRAHVFRFASDSGHAGLHRDDRSGRLFVFPSSGGVAPNNEVAIRFATMEHGGEYPDTLLPQAIKLIDAEGRSSIDVPITQDDNVVDSQCFAFDTEDD